MVLFRRSLESRRAKALKVCRAGPLSDYLASVPGDAKARGDEGDFLAVDLETTGLDAGKDRLLAVGFVPVVGGKVILAQARSIVVAADGEVGASATVHGLTDDQVAAGVSIEAAVAEVLEALTGRVLLAHFATIEVGFLSAACERLWGAPLVVPVVDTFDLQRRIVTGGGRQDPPPGSLRLWAARERYGLPNYRAHDPLIDALSCAELFLAQTAELSSPRS